MSVNGIPPEMETFTQFHGQLALTSGGWVKHSKISTSNIEVGDTAMPLDSMGKESGNKTSFLPLTKTQRSAGGRGKCNAGENKAEIASKQLKEMLNL